LAVGVAALNPVVIGGGGAEPAQRLAVTGDQRAVERRRGAVRAGGAVVDLAVRCRAGCPGDGGGRGCDGPCCDRADRRWRRQGGGGLVTGNAQLAIGVLALDAVVVGGPGGQPAECLTVAVDQRRIRRRRGPVGGGWAVFDLAVGGCVRGPGDGGA